MEREEVLEIVIEIVIELAKEIVIIGLAKEIELAKEIVKEIAIVKELVMEIVIGIVLKTWSLAVRRFAWDPSIMK